MRDLDDTMAGLGALARQRKSAADTKTSRLAELTDVGANPGSLAAYSFAPVHAKALVVVLHGCTQTAAGYDKGSGWSELAERFGFAVLFPEQRRPNNPNLCFNWFQPEDSRRGQGEAESIRQMVARMIMQHQLDPAQVYVTGLSAGGAMASTMLACYPEVFAGGAIIAGLPFGAAASVPQAMERMRGQGHASADAASGQVRAASDHAARWPAVSVWHGSADFTVNASNADAIIGQWQSLHGVGTLPDRTDQIDGVPRRQWLDSKGRVVLEDYRIKGMGHGTPVQTQGEDGLGAAMPFMLDVGISSTWHIARAWGLLEEEQMVAEPPPSAAPLPPATTLARLRPVQAQRVPEPEPAQGASRVGKIQATIETALRQAGLMR